MISAPTAEVEQHLQQVVVPNSAVAGDVLCSSLRAECDRLWRIAELEYPRAASLGEARFLEWQARTWAALEQVMTRVNSLVLAYNCTAPACAAPQTPYNLAHQQARFLERFGRER